MGSCKYDATDRNICEVGWITIAKCAFAGKKKQPEIGTYEELEGLDDRVIVRKISEKLRRLRIKKGSNPVANVYWGNIF